MPANIQRVFTRQFYVSRTITALCCALLVVLTAQAQTDGGLGSDPGDFGNGGRNTIQGRIYLPSGRRPERRMRVRLSTVRNESSTMTDDTGSFSFRRLGGGTYRITVEGGREYEPAGETVDIFDAPPGSPAAGPGQTLTVQIRLEPKAAESGGAEASAVNAALAAVPRKARELYEKALRSAGEGDHKKAVEHLNKAVGVHPDFPLAHNELGVQYTKLGEPEKAAEALREAVRLSPEDAMPRLNYGAVLIHLKKFADAEAALREAVKRDAALAPARLYLGRALIGMNRLDDAEKELREALRLGGDAYAVVHRYLAAVHIERGESERAADALEIYLRLVPHAKDADQMREMIKQLRGQGTPERE